MIPTPPNSGPVAVVGLGLSGLAAVRFLLRQGLTVVAFDERFNYQPPKDIDNHPQLSLHLGPITQHNLTQYPIIFRSPGLPPTHPGLQPVIQAGGKIINDIEWLYQCAKEANPQTRFIGITGTNGKSTVTTMTGAIFDAANRSTGTGGNLGPAALELWNPEHQFYCLELSSFQLENIRQFRAHVALLLNITPDHLNHHGTLKAYRQAKRRLFLKQKKGDFSLINYDDLQCRKKILPSLRNAASTTIPFSIKKAVQGGFFMKGKQIFDLRTSNRTPYKPIITLNNHQLLAPHNQTNALAATAIASVVQIPTATIERVLNQFKGLPHRFETIRTLDQVTYINDSKATNVDATLQAISAFKKGLIIILGGSDKGSDFSPLKEKLKPCCKIALLIGASASHLEKTLSPTIATRRIKDLSQAILEGQRLAEPGDTLLLSPACASLDQFNNFEARGDHFRDCVHGLKTQQ
ncbi:UDP-N-acetylmuramoyl-L-alanine--D-glutamate ligase [Magnetococcales bacterium HHB-1]